MKYVKFAILTVSIIGAVGLAASAQQPTKVRPGGSIAAGRELYVQHCSVCHGMDAKGYGSMYDPDSGEPSKRVPPANLTILSERNSGKFPADQVRDSIYSKSPIPAHGTPNMPAWGDVFYSLKSRPNLLEARVRDLTAYIESIQAGKSKEK